MAATAFDLIQIQTDATDYKATFRTLIGAGTAIASGTITPRDDDINLSGGSIGDVITVQADGSLALSTPAGGAESPLVLTANNATETPLTIQGAASQTANLTEWETSAGTLISSVSIGTGSPGGSITGGRFQAARSDLTSQTTQYDWSGIVCSGAGNVFRILSSLGISLQGAVTTTGSFTVGGNITGNSLITFGLDRAGVVGGGFFIAGTTRKVGIWNNNPSAQIDVHCNSATTVGCIIKGAASQTANLQEWQNSAGTVLSAVRADGSTKPAALADADAVNDSIYYSTDAAKLVYKDASGTVNNLY